jgi:hypothetical protein
VSHERIITARANPVRGPRIITLLLLPNAAQNLPALADD